MRFIFLTSLFYFGILILGISASLGDGDFKVLDYAIPILLFVGYPLGIIAFKRWSYAQGYEIMYNFQTEWKIILEAIP